MGKDNTKANDARTTAPSTALGEHKEEIVAFHDADIDFRDSVTITNGFIYELSGNRKVEVWKVKDEEGYAVRIFRPTNDGKMSKLLFGLTHDAAQSLLYGLTRHLFPSLKGKQGSEACARKTE